MKRRRSTPAGGDDGFFGKYIWDEETGRLYEITEDPKRSGTGCSRCC